MGPETVFVSSSFSENQFCLSINSVTAHTVKKANILNLFFFDPYPPPPFPRLRGAESRAIKMLLGNILIAPFYRKYGIYHILKRNALIYTPFPKTREGLGGGVLFFVKRV